MGDSTDQTTQLLIGQVFEAKVLVVNLFFDFQAVGQLMIQRTEQKILVRLVGTRVYPMSIQVHQRYI